MKKRNIKIIIIVVAIAAIAVILYQVLKGKKDTEFSYITVQEERGDIQNLVTATGTVNALKTVQVGTQVSGVVSKIFVDFNSKVKQGQVIAVLDTRSLQVSLDEARQNLAKAEAQLEQVQAEYERNQILYDKGLISRSDLDMQIANLKTAETTVKNARNEVSKSSINLNLATITAPISGVVISRNVDVGQTVASSFSTPTLFTIANDLTQMRLQANVDEADIGQVKVGQHAFFTVDTYPDLNFGGVVQEIRMEPITTSNVVSYAVMIDATNDDLKLLPGMIANISIIVNEAKDVMKIPVAALNFSPAQQRGLDSNTIQKKRDSLAAVGKSLVFVLDKGKMTPVAIETGLSDGIKIEVKGGDLTPQSQIVVGSKQSGVTTPQGKGLFPAPQRGPRR